MLMTFVSDLGGIESAVCMHLPILLEDACSDVTLLCTSKYGNAEWIINDAIVGWQALGNTCQINNFQKCFEVG